MLIEREYIDSFYLEDYSKYYSKCFCNYNKYCARIHFFNTSEDKLKHFFERVYKSDRNIQYMKKRYLGYMVIRPIPFTFIGKTCLKKWQRLGEEKHHLVSRKVSASVMGINFEIDTVPFQEQDKVLSVCATSALWSFFQGHKDLKINNILSPYEITQEAIANSYSQCNNLVNSGLSVDMICGCIKRNGLVPILYDKKEIFLEVIHTYLSSGYPVIIGLNVHHSEKESDDKSIINNNEKSEKQIYENRKENGNDENYHAVVALGDFVNKNGSGNFNKEISLVVNYVDRLYIHDDRIGPYARLDRQTDTNGKEKWILSVDENASVSVEKFQDEEYELINVIVGVYNKIRLPYTNVVDFSFNLKEEFLSAFSKVDNAKTNISRLDWDIKLEENNNLKNRIRINNLLDKSTKQEILDMSLPRYCWGVQAIGNRGCICFELIFDTTELPQGNILTSVVVYNKKYNFLFIRLRKFFDSLIKIKGGKEFKAIIGRNLISLYNYMHKPKKLPEVLDNLYGYVHTPKYLKTDEIVFNDLKNQEATVFTCSEDANGFNFDESIKYLWVIDANGMLVIGKEDGDKDSVYQGHPTLIYGKQGRIGGELFFENNIWKINTKSGRYSSPYTPEQQKLYLENALKELFGNYFKGIDFKPQHQ